MAGRILSAKSSKEEISRILQESDNFLTARLVGKPARETAGKDFHALVQKGLKSFKAEDHLAIYRDQDLHTQWKETCCKYVEYTFLVSLRRTEILEEQYGTLEKDRRILMDKLERVAPVEVPIFDSEYEDIVKEVESIMDTYPGVRARLLETRQDQGSVLVAEYRRLHDTIDNLKTHLKDEILTELEKRVMSFFDWRELMQHFEMVETPAAAWTRTEELQTMQGELDAKQAENSSLHDQLKVSKEEIEELVSTKEYLEGRVKEEEGLREESDGMVAAAKREANERVREAITEADSKVSDALKEVAAHKADVETLTRELDGALQAEKRANNEATAAKEQSRIDLQKAEDGFSGRLAEAQQQIGEATTSADKVDAELAFAKADKEIAVENLQTARQKLEEAQNSHRELEVELNKVNGLLEQANSGRVTAEGALQTASEELTRRIHSLNLANDELESVKKDLNHETRVREHARAASRKSDELLALKTKQQERLEERARKAERDNATAKSELRTEISKRETSERFLDERRELEERRSQRDQEILEEVRTELRNERQEHKRKIDELRALRRQNATTEQALKAEKELLAATRTFLSGQVKTLEEDVEAQRQAVTDFLKHGFGSTSATAPSVEQMVMLRSKRQEPIASDGIPGLPVIVVACGRLPAEWSYLSFASAGVLMDSRFNQQLITAAVSTELPYIHDALVRTVHAVANEPVSARLQLTLMVVLQGIAYIHLATKISPGMVLKPSPSNLLDSLIKLDQGEGSVLGMMYKRAYDLVHLEVRFSSWIFEEFAGERLDSSKTALPEGVVLIHRDSPGTVFMNLSTTKEQLFVIDEVLLSFDYLGWTSVKMRLPSIDGLPYNLRQMDLVTKVEHGGVLSWTSSITKRQISNM